MPWKWYEGSIIKIEDFTDKVKRFWIEVHDEALFDFHAGQFITLDLPISDKRLKRWRSYSIANPPDQSNVIELCIVRLEGGLGTNYLFNEAEIGTKVKFKGPSGAFYLEHPLDSDLVMICTGTGVAPFRSMIFDLVRKGKFDKNIHLIYGARKEEDILYRDEFEKLAIKLSSFTYDVCLSREEDWNGYKGYVHQVYMDGYNNGELADKKIYLCGWSQMIDEAVENLLIHKKLERKKIIYELYG